MYPPSGQPPGPRKETETENYFEKGYNDYISAKCTLKAEASMNDIREYKRGIDAAKEKIKEDKKIAKKREVETFRKIPREVL